MITALVHGWRKADPDEHYYVIVDVADIGSDEVWQSAEQLNPHIYWHYRQDVDAAVPGELKDRVLSRAKFYQVTQTRLELFRALRQLSDNEAKDARDDYDHLDTTAWYKTVEKIFFTAAAHDVLISDIADSTGVYSLAGGLLEVARLAIDRANAEKWSRNKDWGRDLDPVLADLLLQEMPEGLPAAARAEYVRAKFAAADPEPDPDVGPQPEPTPQERTAGPMSTDMKARAARLRAKFGIET